VDHCKKIEWFDEVDSTNSRLIADKETKCSGTVYCALYQTAGRGQRGNRWEARAGENLMFSLLLKPDNISADRQFVISQATALAVAQYLQTLGIAAKIKWPNDIYVDNSKICGILIENFVSEGHISASIIGVGLNLNQSAFPEDLVNATSATLLTGRKFDLRAELESLVDLLLDWLSRADNPASGQMLTTSYLSNLYRKDEWHDYIDRTNCNPLIATTEKVDGHRFRGRIKGLSPTGCLIIEDKKTGEEKLFAFKELSYVL